MTGILVAVDLAASNTNQLLAAEQMAKALGAKLWVLHAADPDPDFVGYGVGPPSVRHDVARRHHEEHVRLQAIAERFRSAGLEASALLIQGPAVEAIVSEREKLDCAMVIIGSHPHGLFHQLLKGNVGDGLIKRLCCPVLVVPEGENP
jgi:nucleotide-binding universal stress UspA family protein